MRKYYKNITRTFILLSLLMTAEWSIAQENSENERLQRAVINYAVGIQSNNYGVVRSSLYHTMVLKRNNPQLNIDVIIEALNQAKLNDDTFTARKLSIVNFFLHNPELLINLSDDQLKSIDSLYSSISEKMTVGQP